MKYNAEREFQLIYSASKGDRESYAIIYQHYLPKLYKYIYDILRSKEHRTPHLSGPLSLILQINRQLQGIKKGEKLSFDNLSPLVASGGFSLNIW
jgi:hypothetical protein